MIPHKNSFFVRAELENSRLNFLNYIKELSGRGTPALFVMDYVYYFKLAEMDYLIFFDCDVQYPLLAFLGWRWLVILGLKFGLKRQGLKAKISRVNQAGAISTVLEKTTRGV